MTTDPITLTAETHRFFDQLATAQAATAAYLLGHVIQAGGSARAFQIGSPISQVCYTRLEEIEFDPTEALGSISKQMWPSVIHLKFHGGTGRPLSTNSNPTAVQLLMGSLYEHAFITYYEKNVDGVKAKHGGKRHWPNILTFGRIVRNAFAHGGTINITDGMSATWGGLRYSDADNGRRVLYNDLSQGDLTLLMIDMDSEF